MSDEYFDVVDENDLVIGRETRRQVHAQGLLHRAVHIFVFNPDGHLLIHKRAATKDEWPSLWTSSASGHVDSGEGYDQAAHRELDEELGLAGQLECLNQFSASPETANEHTVLYSLVSDDTPTFQPEEIEEGRFVALGQLDHELMAQPEQFTPAFRKLYAWYRESIDS